jgi:hypothetical protein
MKIDKWDSDKLDLESEEWQKLIKLAFTPIFHTDKNGNLWIINHEKAELIKRKGYYD